MRCLLIELPLPGAEGASPSGVWRHAQLLRLEDPSEPPLRASSLHLLPRPDRQTQVVGVIPSAALSWHRVAVPPALRRSKHPLPAVLAGLLEDRLLDEPARLHLAIGPQSGPEDPLWVAACDRAWLHERLRQLQQTGIRVDRLVPEMVPPASGREAWLVGDDTHSGWFWSCDALQGVWRQPVAGLMDAGSGARLGRFERIQSEPALAQWAQHKLDTQPVLGTTATRWLQALDSRWDLAQFDLALGRRARHWRSAREALARLAFAPAWRAARWGLFAVLATQLLGLNLWAMQMRADWAHQQQALTALVTRTFSHLTLVIDAPLQMQREVDRLRQATGQLGPRDLETLLAALEPVWPATQPPTALRYDGNRLTLEGLNLPPPAAQSLALKLQAAGHTWQLQGATGTLQPAGARP
jgi:general secretion pathway protein L